MAARLEETTDVEAAAFLERALLASLRQMNEQAVNSRLTLVLREGGTIVGGLDGATSYGWLLVKVLWVDPAFRRGGLGRRLMERAAEAARERGCHGLWLDTSDAAAADFYRKLGFSEFGRLSNGSKELPAGHRRWFLKRSSDVPGKNAAASASLSGHAGRNAA